MLVLLPHLPAITRLREKVVDLSDHLLDGKRFFYVILRPGLESFEHVFRDGVSRDHDDRYVTVDIPGPYLVTYGKAVLPGKNDIEHYEIWKELVIFAESSFAVEGILGIVSPAPQRFGDYLDYVGIIVDYENITAQRIASLRRRRLQAAPTWLFPSPLSRRTC